MSKPWLASTKSRFASLVDRWASRLFAADLLLEKPQTPQWNRLRGANRPSGPAGIGCVQHRSATRGASRLATAQALGGLQTSAPLPEISQRLFAASSHATASGGRKA